MNAKAAPLLGTTKDQILINDIKVNPISKSVYMSVSRGKGPDAVPVILKVDSTGKLSEFALDNVEFAVTGLSDAPASKPGQRGDPRNDAITQIAFVNGNVVIAGLSNQEFASDLRSIPFPFKGEPVSTGVKMYHGSHGRYETQSPVRTFVPFSIGNEQFILAAYTCTPLVKIPVSELKPGAKVESTTIAELEAGNRPLDILAYKKSGKDYFLLANSARNVMKLDASNFEQDKPIVAHTEIAGVPYTTIAGLTNVKHLSKLDDSTAVMLVDKGGTIDLRAVPLPYPSFVGNHCVWAVLVLAAGTAIASAAAEAIQFDGTRFKVTGWFASISPNLPKDGGASSASTPDLLGKSRRCSEPMPCSTTNWCLPPFSVSKWGPLHSRVS